MSKILFFDDDLLYERENVMRGLGTPEFVRDAVFSDGKTVTPLATPWVFRLPDGRYRMVYQGLERGNLSNRRLYGAVSADGMHFTPEDYSGFLDIPDRFAANEIFRVGGGDGEEVGTIFEDFCATSPESRFRMILTLCVGNGPTPETSHYCKSVFYVSPDLIHWRRETEAENPLRCEPMMSAFCNADTRRMTLVNRPWWGVRKAGILETGDWKTFSDYTVVLQADSLDTPLAELYGMIAFAYDGMYIGLPHIYDGALPGLNPKYFGGTMKPQLAYSYNGRNWFRSIRKPFLSGCPEDDASRRNDPRPMVWATGNARDADGNVLLYAAATKMEHGPAFHDPKSEADIFVYRLRKDGFVCLRTRDASRESAVATRQIVWHGGPLHININACRATVALFETTRVWGQPEPIAGFGHADCVPIEGDCADWTPAWRDGRAAAELSGRVITAEIRFTDGELYSISGDMTTVFGTQANRYLAGGGLPPASRQGRESAECRSA